MRRLELRDVTQQPIEVHAIGGTGDQMRRWLSVLEGTISQFENGAATCLLTDTTALTILWYHAQCGNRIAHE